MKQKTCKKIMALVAILLAVNFVFFFAAPVLGAGNVDDLWGGTPAKTYIKDNSGLPTNTTGNDPRQVAANIIRFILGFLGILAVIIILFAGFKWMTAGGNEENVAAAKKILIAGLIGLVIILSAYVLANFVISQIYGATTGTPPVL